MQKNKVIVILGPTASGKSALAIRIARDFDGEIISADSRQVYRGMDIGTGKVPKESGGDVFISEGIVHHAIDIMDPDEDFNVSDFKKYAEIKIKEIVARGKLPIICGGTGFWISAVVDDLDFPKVAPDKELRDRLGKKSAEELLEELQRFDSERAKTIDQKNKVRLIRAIEICEALGCVPKPRTRNPKPSPYEFLQIGIQTEKEILHLKIKKRLDERFENGMIEEVEKLHNPPAGGGVSWERLESFGLEYRRIAEFLQEKISQNEMEERLCFDIIHYAKRQMTWFKKDKRIFWLSDYGDIEKSVSDFLRN